MIPSFSAHGRTLFGDVLDKAACAALLDQLRAGRPDGEGLFLDEAEFDANPEYRGVNPRPGRNLLERHGDGLDFVENNPALVDGLGALLGPGYRILDRKVVMGVPEARIPDWLKRRIRGNFVNNLGPYVRPQYRDVTYFWGIDLHQDIIDWRNREADFVTLYVYLHDVGVADAPLFLLPGSHRFGATTFPHELTAGDGDVVTYGDGHGRTMKTRYERLTGPAGTVGLWHSCVLHGTQPDRSDHPRLSLRYLIARDPDAEHAGIDDVNAAIEGPLSLAQTREDLDEQGAAAKSGNVVNTIKAE
ncbi:phytanoyl-CoA dioxygenase family protein [Yunchengibacter salinarum]|uniref:phytanoyl-CoA dioxygenase family protein n=1 Tax=Yunchengibacter salinarum TaxID=3133399 RepID=UPI0035B651A3